MEALPPALPQLPNELVLDILLRAAEDDLPTAHTLAYVSRAVCALSAPFRWKCIVITSREQLYSLWWSIVFARGDKDDIKIADGTLAHLHRKRGSKKSSTYASTTPISIPSVRPGSLTTDLYIETEAVSSTPSFFSEHLISHFDEALWEPIQQVCPRVMPSPEHSNYISSVYDLIQHSGKAHMTMGAFLKSFANLERFSIGVEESPFLTSRHPPAPAELSLVYEGNEAQLNAILSSPDGVRRRLQRVHIVGIDPRAGIAGVEPPFTTLEPIRSGSVSQDSFLRHAAEPSVRNAARFGGVDLDLNNVGSCGVTHLRYDTRRFALRPASIIASRLRPFLQELVVSDTNSATASQPARSTAELAPAPNFSYAGRPHAAPAYGAGNSSGATATRSGPLSVLEDTSDEAAILRSWGVGRFERLQLAWEAKGAPKAEDLPWARRARFTAVESTPTDKTADSKSTAGGFGGGWPREARDVWTERSDRELVSTFQAELVECVQELYGWSPVAQPPRGEDVPQSSLRYLFAPPNRGEYGPLIANDGGLPLQVVAQALSQITSRPVRTRNESTTDEDQKTLGFAVRAPSTLLKLGGAAAFEKEARIAYFLDRAKGGRGAW